MFFIQSEGFLEGVLEDLSLSISYLSRTGFSF